MKNVLIKFFIALLFAITFIQEKSYSNEVNYEFLTPKVLVLKTKTLPKLSSKENSQISQTGFWYKENALKRDSKGKILKKADITCFFYILFKEPFKVNEKRKISNYLIKYDENKPSNLYKLNQLGNGIKQKKKFAYLGAWLGNIGPLNLHKFNGKEFEIRNSLTHKCVYKNVIKSRSKDPLYQNKIPFTGEDVLELDYSNFYTQGEYYFYVKGIGRSQSFNICSETINEAFYIHAKGLYHKRCGIAKTSPYTNWTSLACHQKVYLGKFPGNNEDYLVKKHQTSGFKDKKGNYVKVNHFDLIKQNQLPIHKEYIVSGGWHDAADYDRRPYHLSIVSNLAQVYLMKEENFIDNQLNIPESNNNIPDILDEAAWGLKHLLTLQQKDGQVGTWVETTGHPQFGEGFPHQDKRTYYVSKASRNSTLEYASCASVLALAMKKAKANKEYLTYLKSAQKAWDFAINKNNQLIQWFYLKGKMLNYMENNQLDGINLLKAGVNLYVLTKNKKYLQEILHHKERILHEFNQNYWKYSPLDWMTLELKSIEELTCFQQAYRKKILKDADIMLKDQETAYPYRTLWHNANAGWVHAMAWGNYHPLRRALTLVAAHKITQNEKYLTGIYLANDFHNGANPLGRTMTSGLGKIYPVVFLDLVSYCNNFQEFVLGITPYGNTFGIDRNAIKMVYNTKADLLPIFRRYVNLEFLSVPASEYSVWETIGPAVAVTGYLIEKPSLPSNELKSRKPASNFKKLAGYQALP